MSKSLVINRSQLSESEIHRFSNTLQEGQVLLQIESFAMTSNNVTYAVVGEQMSYWNFFPAKEGFGIIPTWGFATVTESQHEQLSVGDRFYGYYPMGQQLVVQPDRISEFGFIDSAEHRTSLPPVYNSYTKVSPQASDEEHYMSILRPLFMTSYLNYHFLKSNDFFTANQIILTSASSKTALALAYMLKSNQLDHGNKIIGLTSTKNIDFVKKSSYYDHVLSYDQVNSIENEGSVTVDFAGNSKTLLSIQNHLSNNSKFMSMIGLTDWTSMDQSAPLKNAKFFFAPDFAVKYYKQHGAGPANAMIQDNMKEFIKQAAAWIEIEFIDTLEALQPTYVNMLNGKIDPSKGYIVKPN